MAPTSAIKSKTDRDWEIERAADTLLDAEKIGKNPKLLRAALAELRKRQTAIAAALPSKTPGRALMKKT